LYDLLQLKVQEIMGEQEIISMNSSTMQSLMSTAKCAAAVTYATAATAAVPTFAPTGNRGPSAIATATASATGYEEGREGKGEGGGTASPPLPSTSTSTFPNLPPPAKTDKEVVLVLEEYNRRLAARGKMDFDDVLIKALQLFVQHPEVMASLKHVFLDEFQDTNELQYQLAKRMAHAGSLTVVGDPDQSIYSWRNANVKGFEQLRADFPQSVTIQLKENYRSTGHILSLAAATLLKGSEGTTAATPARAARAAPPHTAPPHTAAPAAAATATDAGNRAACLPPIANSQWTSNGAGIVPVLLELDTPEAEAGEIATKIEQLYRTSNGLLQLADFARCFVSGGQFWFKGCYWIPRLLRALV
jgi:superfamily I DNA/RNA helicase